MCEYNTSTSVRQWLYSAPKFVFVLTTILLAVFAFSLISRDPIFSDELPAILASSFDNMHKQPIKELHVSSDGTCPEDYELATLGYWNGTAKGCFQPQTGRLTNGSCTPNRQGNIIDSVSSKELTAWNGKTICIQRTKNLQYTKPHEICSEDLLQCSYNTCLDPSESCPVLDLDVVETASKTPEGFEEIQIDDTKKFIFARGATDQSGEFILDFQLALFNAPCINPTKHPAPKRLGKQFPYPLSVVPETGCDEYGYTEYQVLIETLPAEEVLTGNGLSADTINTDLPKYHDFIEGENAYFLARKRYTIRHGEECLGLSSAGLERLRLYEEDFIDTTEYFIAFSALLAICFTVTVAIEIYLRMQNKPEQVIALKFFAYVNIAGLFATFLLFVFQGWQAMLIKDEIYSEIMPLKFARHFDCFKQEEVKSILVIFLDRLRSDIEVILALSVTLLLLSVIGLVLTTILTLTDIWQLRKDKASYMLMSSSKDKRKQKKKNDVNNNKNMELLPINSQ